ncbi:polar amino acid ABC transporter permease [Aureimonas ureilytica]|uniref:Polar amino acid ABC transporter permease n=1 Tax=Aureimonas ureilytica TaxID=401562 RepID=A0A175R9G0_9HYPH|nr:amino acid ABC transporter permease [Aureimonas ureilytica]KTQ96455.1 polar amino acid ABC transporter permease [Aureimonas ureilytica]
MPYQFDFSWLLPYAPALLNGVRVTLQLILVGGTLGILVGIACAWVRALGPKALRWPVSAYVEMIRNTPFLIQLFFIFFGLPGLGIQMDEMSAAYLAMTINLGAYACEIIRAGIEATPKGQYEAGASLAMTRWETFRHVVLVPSLQRIWPALSSQVVIVMLGSAVVSQIAVEDLTFVANFIQSRNFRAFETYLVSTLIYLALAILVRRAMGLLGSALFPQRRPA